jgi:hypothetical protein
VAIEWGQALATGVVSGTSGALVAVLSVNLTAKKQQSAADRKSSQDAAHQLRVGLDEVWPQLRAEVANGGHIAARLTHLARWEELERRWAPLLLPEALQRGVPRVTRQLDALLTRAHDLGFYERAGHRGIFDWRQEALNQVGEHREWLSIALHHHELGRHKLPKAPPERPLPEWTPPTGDSAA